MLSTTSRKIVSNFNIFGPNDHPSGLVGEKGEGVSMCTHHLRSPLPHCRPSVSSSTDSHWGSVDTPSLPSHETHGPRRRPSPHSSPSPGARRRDSPDHKSEDDGSPLERIHVKYLLRVDRRPPSYDDFRPLAKKRTPEEA